MLPRDLRFEFSHVQCVIRVSGAPSDREQLTGRQQGAAHCGATPARELSSDFVSVLVSCTG